MKKHIKKQIRKAVRAISPLFLEHKWIWAGIKGDGIPRAWDIDFEFRRLYKELKNSDNMYIATGRLCVLKSQDGEYTDYSFLLEP